MDNERKDKTKEMNNNYSLCFFSFKNNLDKTDLFTVTDKNNLEGEVKFNTDIKSLGKTTVKKWYDQTENKNNLIQTDITQQPILTNRYLEFNKSKLKLENTITLKKNRFTLIIHFDLNRQIENDRKFIFRSYKNNKNEIAIRIKSDTELEFILDNNVVHTILINKEVDQYICWRYFSVGDMKTSSVYVNGKTLISDDTIDVDVLVKKNMEHELNANMKLYGLAWYSWNIDFDQIEKVKQSFIIS